MKISSVADFDAALKQGPYADGGYPLFFVTADGSALSFKTAREEAEQIRDAIRSNRPYGDWRVVAMDVNWENSSLFDDHSGERIESAYAEDEGQSAEGGAP